MLLFFNSSSSAFHSLNLFLIPLLPLLLLFFFLFLYFTSSSEIHPSLLCILLRLGLNGNEYQVMYHGKKNETQSQHRSWVASLEKRKILWEGLLEFNFLKNIKDTKKKKKNYTTLNYTKLATDGTYFDLTYCFFFSNNDITMERTSIVKLSSAILQHVLLFFFNHFSFLKFN